MHQKNYKASKRGIRHLLNGLLLGCVINRQKGAESFQRLFQLSEVYLDMGDDLYVNDTERLLAYQNGADFAAQTLTQDQQNAEAHFLYAANLGHVVQLRGIIAAALSINDILAHVKKTVILDSRHARALHMLGRMYDELPWIMGGFTEGPALSEARG